ncbi:MAG: adenylate/guanylate cyclase domain-containing protein [Nitrospiraceae bacterium]
MDELTPGEQSIRRSSEVFRAGARGDLETVDREVGDSDYRVTAQFWYRTAFDVDQPMWSNIYPLPVSRGFGVSTTQAIERDGLLMGVLGIAISLDRLSSFLDGIEITSGSSVLLTNVSEQLLAVQNEAATGEVNHKAGNTLVRLNESTLPAVRIVVNALRASDIKLQDLQKTRQITYQDDLTGENYLVTLSPLSQMGLVVGIVIPERDILIAVNRNTRLLFLALAGFLVVVLAVATALARVTLGRPLTLVVENLRRLEDFQNKRIEPIFSQLTEIREVSEATVRMGVSLASFGKYIPTELVRTLFEQGIEAKPGGEKRELSIMFIDLANFTHISEMLGEGIVDFLSDYLTEMSSLIQKNGGTIDKYMGDGIMAFWGAPVPDPAHALNACRAALGCQVCLTSIRSAQVNAVAPQLRARIGINTGSVLVGNFGSNDRLNYTVVGDKVNVASRLESLSRIYGTEIIIGEATFAQVRDHVLARVLDQVAVYGKDESIAIYELLAMKENAPPEMTGWIERYERAHSLMRSRDWDQAIALFKQVIALRGGVDSVSSLQIARIMSFKANPPPREWDALVVMESK